MSTRAYRQTFVKVTDPDGDVLSLERNEDVDDHLSIRIEIGHQISLSRRDAARLAKELKKFAKGKKQ